MKTYHKEQNLKGSWVIYSTTPSVSGAKRVFTCDSEIEADIELEILSEVKSGQNRANRSGISKT